MSREPYKTYSREFKIEAVRLADQSDRPECPRPFSLSVYHADHSESSCRENEQRGFSGVHAGRDRPTEAGSLGYTAAPPLERLMFIP